MKLLDYALSVFSKLGFVTRYFWHLLAKAGRLKMEWFVFLEPGVVFKIGPGSRVILKKNCYIKGGAVFEAIEGGRIVLGEGAGVGHYACIGASRLVSMGRGSIIGQSCTLVDSAHVHDLSVALDKSGYTYGQLILEDEVIVYPKATIGPNLRIAKGTLIGAHAFVNKSIDTGYGLYVGIPARRVRDL